MPFWNERRVSNVRWCLCIVEGQEEDRLLVQELRLQTFGVFTVFFAFVLKVRYIVLAFPSW